MKTKLRAEPVDTPSERYCLKAESTFDVGERSEC